MTGTRAPAQSTSSGRKPGPGRDQPSVPWRTLLPAMVLITVAYLLTTTWTSPYTVDPFTNAVQARSFAADASPIIEEAEGLTDPAYQGSLAWFTDSPDGPTSQYPPGVAVWGALFYVFDSSQEQIRSTWVRNETGETGVVDLWVPSFVPAALASVTSVSLAIWFLGLTVWPLTTPIVARNAMIVAGLGTSAWSVASDKLWQHGPAMMMIALGTYLSSRNRWYAAGGAFAAALLVRPHTAVIAAAIGLSVAIARRDPKPALKMGSTAAIGMVLLVVYNAAVFGQPSISGGYGEAFGERARTTGPLVLVERMVRAFIDPDVGMLMTSPVLLVCLLGLWSARKRTPDWAIGAAVGGLVYLVAQYQANRVSGGSAFFSYRYPLEALTAAAAMLTIGAVAWTGGDRRRRQVLVILSGASILFHAIGASG